MQANKDSIKVTGLDHEAEVLGLALAVKAKSLVLGLALAKELKKM